jgi:hypothetical protein
VTTGSLVISSGAKGEGPVGGPSPSGCPFSLGVAEFAVGCLDYSGACFVLALVGAHVLDALLVALGKHGAHFVHAELVVSGPWLVALQGAASGLPQPRRTSPIRSCDIAHQYPAIAFRPKQEWCPDVRLGAAFTRKEQRGPLAL